MLVTQPADLRGHPADVLDQAPVRHVARAREHIGHAFVREFRRAGGEARELLAQGGRHVDPAELRALEVLDRVGDAMPKGGAGPERRIAGDARKRAELGGEVGIGLSLAGHELDRIGGAPEPRREIADTVAGVGSCRRRAAGPGAGISRGRGGRWWDGGAAADILSLAHRRVLRAIS